jgi:hypothetical protein
LYVETETIRALDGLSKVSNGDLVSRGTSVQTNMTGNANFPNPPVNLADLKAAIERFSALMAEALDGSKRVIAEKNKQRETVIKMLRLLARYVEFASKDDVAIFNTSGFELASTTKVQPPPLSEKIRKIEHGANSGQIVVWIKAVPNASSYELRYAVGGSDGTSGTWTTQIVTNVKTSVTIQSLTPGATYVFQARALAKDGYTDWTDSVTFMCT